MMKTNNKKYNVTDEHGRPIESNINLKRAQATIKANPDSKLIKSEVKK